VNEINGVQSFLKKRKGKYLGAGIAQSLCLGKGGGSVGGSAVRDNDSDVRHASTVAVAGIKNACVGVLK